jgi:LuxR family maltose regulon positive regulatory protein
MLQPQFVLKTTPPRLPRAAVLRRALINRWNDLQERTAVLVTAPRGFGKTTLLSQWRRAWLERGAFVAWLTLDARDTPGRFVGALFAVWQDWSRNLQVSGRRIGCGRVGAEKEALTALLAVAELAIGRADPDDADRLPRKPRTTDANLMFNAPPTWDDHRCTRPAVPGCGRTGGQGRSCASWRRRTALVLDDTVEILQRRFGDRISLDDCVRLHEIT